MLRELRADRVPILLYHRFVRSKSDLARYPGTENIFTVTTQRFKEQNAKLTNDGYQPVTPAQVFDFLTQGRDLPLAQGPVRPAFNVTLLSRATCSRRQNLLA